ncbi:MAG: cysteine hydrolase [Burkholderiales bacterium]
MKSIYLVLDMENDLVHQDGPNGKSPLGLQVVERKIIEKTKSSILKARKAGLAIGFVRVGFSPDYRECPDTSPVFSAARKNHLFKLGTWGTEIHPDLIAQEGDFQIVKHRVSPFYGTNLEPILRAQGIRRIYASGVSTNGVVQAIAREGHDRDYEVVLLEDCCSALSPAEHECAIAGLKRYCVVTTSAEVEFS